MIGYLIRVKGLPPLANHFTMLASQKRNAADMTEGANGLYS